MISIPIEMIRTHRFYFLSFAIFLSLFILNCSPKTLQNLKWDEFTKKEFRDEGVFARPNKSNSNENLYDLGTEHMVSTDHDLSTKVANEILSRGGNAIDAGVAASFVLCVVRPQSTSLAGGGFALIAKTKDSAGAVATKSRNKKIEVIESYDFRERAPKNITRDAFFDKDNKFKKNSTLFEATAVGVPGQVRGLLLMHERHGLLSREEVLAPAIAIASEGFPMYRHLKSSIKKVLAHKQGPPANHQFFEKTFNAKKKTITQPQLAKTLQLIANTGADAFYKGAIAAEIVQYMQESAGLIDAQDLRDYKVYREQPLWGSYRNFKIATVPLPSSATFILESLKEFEKEPIAELYKNNREKYYQILIKNLSKLYKKRNTLGGDVRVQNPNKTETTHLIVVDKDRNVFTSTQSVNYLFGSRIILPKSGFILNNTMDDFSFANQSNVYGLTGSKKNAVAPNKTPLSSMSPMILLDENQNFYMSTGAPGGSYIVSAVLQSILHSVDLNFSAYANVARTRIHYQNKPNIIFSEPQAFVLNSGSPLADKFPSLPSTIEFKIQKSRAKLFVIQEGSGKLQGAADPRGDGNALGK